MRPDNKTSRWGDVLSNVCFALLISAAVVAYPLIFEFDQLLVKVGGALAAGGLAAGAGSLWAESIDFMRSEKERRAQDLDDGSLGD